MNDPLLRMKEVGERLTVPQSTAYSLVSSGAIPSIRVTERSIRVRSSDLERYIESRRDRGLS